MNKGDPAEADRPSGASGQAFEAVEETNLAAMLPDAEADAASVLRAVVRMSPLAMVLTDARSADQPLVFCNRAVARLTGYSEAEVTGRNCRFLQGRDTDPRAVRLLGDAVRAGGEARVDLWNYRKDASRFWNSMFVGPVTDADGRLIYYFGSQTDPSSRRASEEAANREQRMETVGSMAASLAHEVNNLMTVVVGNVEGLRKVTVRGATSERLQHIEWAARAAGKLTRQMLSFAGRQGLQPEIVDINEVLRGLDRLLGQVAPSASGIDLALHSVPLLAELDVSQLELALLNLVRNAADASPPDARITVAAAGTHGSEGAAAEICVTDRGSGMPPELAAKAMEPFFTTKAHGKGTGLGLSMVAGSAGNPVAAWTSRPPSAGARPSASFSHWCRAEFTMQFASPRSRLGTAERRIVQERSAPELASVADRLAAFARTVLERMFQLPQERPIGKG